MVGERTNGSSGFRKSQKTRYLLMQTKSAEAKSCCAFLVVLENGAPQNPERGAREGKAAQETLVLLLQRKKDAIRTENPPGFSRGQSAEAKGQRDTSEI